MKNFFKTNKLLIVIFTLIALILPSFVIIEKYFDYKKESLTFTDQKTLYCSECNYEAVPSKFCPNCGKECSWKIEKSDIVEKEIEEENLNQESISEESKPENSNIDNAVEVNNEVSSNENTSENIPQVSNEESSSNNDYMKSKVEYNYGEYHDYLDINSSNYDVNRDPFAQNCSTCGKKVCLDEHTTYEGECSDCRLTCKICGIRKDSIYDLPGGFCNDCINKSIEEEESKIIKCQSCGFDTGCTYQGFLYNYPDELCPSCGVKINCNL